MTTSAFLDPKTQEYVILSISWLNEYTSPPDGAPRILAGFCVPWPLRDPDDTIQDMWALLPDVDPGCGYVLTFYSDTIKPRKHWTPERMASNRLRLMKARIRKKDPLFADQFIKKQIASKPDYYDPAAITKEIEERKVWHKQWEKDALESWVTNTQPQKPKEENHAAI